MNKPLRIAFMGTPDFSLDALQALIDSHHELICIYTQPPRPSGRGQKLTASAVHQLAQKNNIEVRHPINFKDEKDVEDFKNLNLDVAIVAAYGLILPLSILEAPRHGCLNIHASLLPRWRGAAPIHRAIVAGDTQTGVTIMQMDKGLDTGDMIVKKSTPITAQTILPALHDELAQMGADLMISCVDNLSEKGTLESVAQPAEGVTYAHMLKKSEGHIDWQKTATEIDRMVRGLNPWPGSYNFIEGKRLKILSLKILNETVDAPVGTILENGKISSGDKKRIQLLHVQPENKKPMDIKTALNGGHITIGDVLT